MTGAGFGGCAIALVAQSEIENFTRIVTENYKKSIGYSPTLFSCESGNGACEI
jgi:galactokinase